MFIALGIYTVSAILATVGIMGSCWLGCRSGERAATTYRGRHL